MLSKLQLKKLVNRYVLDSRALLKNRRYATAIYLSGYTIELALKYRICKIFGFSAGYPETSAEFNRYLARSKKTTTAYIRDIRDLKIHDLWQLRTYSGEELTIDTKAPAEWKLVAQWTATDRYNNKVVRKKKAVDFCMAASTILSILL